MSMETPQETIADRIRAGKTGTGISDKKTEEFIGRVRLDLSKYPGEDKYCDGDIEDTLLDIAMNRSEVEYQSIIEEAKSWEILYHLSPLRENIVEWLPIDKNMKVLEVGAGCGAITGALARKAGSVTCCDLSYKRSRINAYRHMGCDNVTIHVGNFMDVEADLDRDYDYVCLIGVFEYAQAYVQSDDPFGDFLKLIKSHCKKNGNIVIAIENKFGLKYWAGCREDHLGKYFSSIEDYPEGGVVRTFTDRGLIDIAKRCGLKKCRMFYPYPDYKFMTNLYSDARLPHKGELKDNIRNADRDRLKLFNEKDAFDSILDEGLFHLYSNSYMMVIGPDAGVDYARYSNDRQDKYAICTEMYTKMSADTDGDTAKTGIRKRALTASAKEHLAAYVEAGEKLATRYSGSGLEINRAVLSEDGWSISLDYASGTSLEELLDGCLAGNDTDGFVALYKEYLERISYGEQTANITDLDMIFSYILIDGDKWTVIDYEWTVPESRPAKELGFRAIYCYVLEDEKRDKLSLDLIIGLLGITANDAKEYRDQEMAFQKKVTGDHKSFAEIRESIGNRIITIEDGRGDENAETLKHRAQVYFDTGHGFSENESAFEETSVFEVEIPAGCKNLRIDPCSMPCIVTIDDISINGQPFNRGFMNFKSNGHKINSDVFSFATEDPGFTLNLKGLSNIAADSKLQVSMTVTPVDMETAIRMAK